MGMLSAVNGDSKLTGAILKGQLKQQYPEHYSKVLCSQRSNPAARVEH